MHRRKKTGILLCSVALLFMVSAFEWRRDTKAQIVINEVCAHNQTTMSQPNVGTSDYIELYNTGEESVNLAGYSLQKNHNEKNTFIFEDYELPAHSYVVIFAAGVIPDVEEHIFAPYRLSDKDIIYLSDDSGQIIDYVELPATDADVVYARETDGAENWTTMQGSPWDKNELSRKVLVADLDLDPPVFSAESGIYQDGFALEIFGGGIIYYTLDGSEPTFDSLQYTDPIWIEDASSQENRYRNREDFAAQPYEIPAEKVDKATIVRAICVTEDGRSSRISTASYFVGERFAKYHNWEIVSLVADPEDLFGYKGIYVLGKSYQDYLEDLAYGAEEKALIPANYLKHGKEWERNAVVEIFDSDGETMLQAKELGVRIQGASRRWGPIKSFRVLAREKYDGTKEIPYIWFQRYIYPKQLLLRSGYKRNSYLPGLIQNRAVAVQDARPCALFLDGEYWGEYSIQEQCSENYLMNYYGLPQEKIIFIKDNGIRLDDWDERCDEYEDAWESFNYTIEEMGASGEDHYEELAEMIDIQSYIDYLSIQIYLNNNDFTWTKNNAVWRSDNKSDRQYEDGKWRWILYDLDMTCTDAARNDFVEVVCLWDSDYTISNDPLFRTLMRSKTFREQFCRSFIEIADENFSYERVESYLSGIEQEYGITCPEKQFFAERREYIMEYLRETFPEEKDLIDTLLAER